MESADIISPSIVLASFMDKSVFPTAVGPVSTINFLLLMLMASECDNTKIFIISRIVFLAVFLINCYLIKKYAKRDAFE